MCTFDYRDDERDREIRRDDQRDWENRQDDAKWARDYSNRHAEIDRGFLELDALGRDIDRMGRSERSEFLTREVTRLRSQSIALLRQLETFRVKDWSLVGMMWKDFHTLEEIRDYARKWRESLTFGCLSWDDTFDLRYSVRVTLEQLAPDQPQDFLGLLSIHMHAEYETLVKSLDEALSQLLRRMRELESDQTR